MSNHICHIPDLETLMKQYDALGLERFVARYKKCEGLVGDSEAIRYVENIVNEFLKLSKK